MNNNSIIEFFDRMADHWDDDMIRNDRIIGRILDNCGVRSGISVLDVGTGTGVLIPDYLERGVGSILGIDISPRMTKIASDKFTKPGVSFKCCDATEFREGMYDCIMIYNAFPHFCDPEGLIKNLSGLLKPGGTLSVAHGMSRKAIDYHHRGVSSDVSCGLMSENDLADLFSLYLDVTVIISDDEMYQVVGVKPSVGAAL